MNSEMHIRFITVNGKKYLFVDDIAVMIEKVGIGEETDVRNRLNEVANNIRKSSCLTSEPKKV
jgi:hypothetical protein